MNAHCSVFPGCNYLIIQLVFLGAALGLAHLLSIMYNYWCINWCSPHCIPTSIISGKIGVKKGVKFPPADLISQFINRVLMSTEMET